jgi:phage terminase large subunit
MNETIIDTRDFESLLNPVYIPKLYDQHRYLVLKGGADAGKSHFACQKILYRTMTEEGHRFLIIRKVKDTIRDSVFKLFCDYIYAWDLEDEFKINQTSFKITFKGNGNTIIFKGCDKEEKLKSIEGITGIWIEEAAELYLKDFEEINRRLRGIYHTYMQIILSYNPVLKSNWTYKRFFQNVSKKDKTKIRILTTTYKDNIFAKDDQEYIDILEGYTGNNRKVYTLGQYGHLENAVYTNWRMIDDIDFPDDEPDYGLDFGFIAPMALVKVVVDMEERKIYLHEEYYKTRKTIKLFAEDIEEKNLKEKRIIADSEAPDKIEELINDYGYSYVEPANKNKGSVIAGIDFVNQFEILITKSSTNIKREIEGYERKKDKEGTVLEQPEKGIDHAMDAFRYVLYTIFYTEGEPYFYVPE